MNVYHDVELTVTFARQTYTVHTPHRKFKFKVDVHSKSVIQLKLVAGTSYNLKTSQFTLELACVHH